MISERNCILFSITGQTAVGELDGPGINANLKWWNLQAFLRDVADPPIQRKDKRALSMNACFDLKFSCLCETIESIGLRLMI